MRMMALPDLATWYWFNVLIRALAGGLWFAVTCITWRSYTPLGKRTMVGLAALILTSFAFTLFKTSGDVSRGIHNVLYIGFGIIAAQTLWHMKNGATVLGIKASTLRDAVDALNGEGADRRVS